MVDLNPDTVEMCALKAYESPHFILNEFKDDFKHFNYLKRLFRRYNKDKILRERLVLNHLVAIFNVFEVYEATRLLFYTVGVRDYPALKTFLLFMGLMPASVEYVRGITINSYDITIDPTVARFLKGLRKNVS